MCRNQWSTSEVHISWFQDKLPTQREQLNRDDTTKIIKLLDNENPFEVNSATQHSCDAGIVVHDSRNVDMQQNKRSLTKWLMIRFQTLCSSRVTTYPVKATSDTVSVNPLLLLQQYIFVGYDSREQVDVLKYELCVYLTTLFEANWNHATIHQISLSKSI